MVIPQLRNSLQDSPKQEFKQKISYKLSDFPTEEEIKLAFSEAEYEEQRKLALLIQKLQRERNNAWYYLQFRRKDIHKFDMFDVDYITPFPPPKPAVNFTI